MAGLATKGKDNEVGMNKACICETMEKKVGYGAISFDCPEHGKVKIDKRALVTYPVFYSPSRLQPGTVPYQPNYPVWFEPNVSTVAG